MSLTQRKAPRPKGQGQWALGYREPLNGAEQIKKEAEPLEVRERIERIFAPGGFRSIGKQDLRNRMRWWGLYTQRKQGLPGERTGSAEPEELEDEFFMLRIRIDGGRLSSEQLRAIAWASETFGRDLAEVTDRKSVQLHWIRIEDAPAIWDRLESTGLTTAEACGDTPRVILGCPLAGIDGDEILDATPAIAEIRDRFIGTTEFSNLPRKYKSSISGCAVRCTDPEINDVSLVGVEHPELGPGFDLWVGGGLSTNPMFAQRLGAFVTPERAAGGADASPRPRRHPPAARWQDVRGLRPPCRTAERAPAQARRGPGRSVRARRRPDDDAAEARDPRGPPGGRRRTG